MEYQNTFHPILEDVQKQYVKYRKNGETRAAAIERIREDYAQELQDNDDRLAVLLGLSLSLCKKRELVAPVAAETLSEIQRVYQEGELDQAAYAQLAEYENCFRNDAVYGKEAIYKRISKYTPAWKIGDTFSHALTYPTAEALGIKNWFILLYKVGEYVDAFGAHFQLMYVSLCPPDKIPTCPEDLQALGFLPMMQAGDRSEYLAQVSIQSKKDENAYGLTFIGCYPNLPRPDDCCDENPCTAMPLLGRLRQADPWPSYEDQICRLYKKYGRI